MSEAKHTPGPWAVEGGAGPTTEYGQTASVGIYSVPAREDAYADEDIDDAEQEGWVCGIWGEIGPIDRANARLIAAAPDLLEALHLVGMSAGWQYLAMETRGIIEAALVKASPLPPMGTESGGRSE